MNAPTPSPEPMVRCFVALPLDAGLIPKLRQIQQSLRKSVPADAVRWVGEEQMHLTLKFFGDTPSAQIPNLVRALQKSCAGLPSFQLEARGLGCFPNARQPRVVWVGIQGDRERLLELQSRIERQTQSWGSHEETRAFSPHLTLGRIKSRQPGEVRGLGNAIQNHPQESLGTWTAQQVLLIQSRLNPQGSQYTPLAEVKLL